MQPILALRSACILLSAACAAPLVGSVTGPPTGPAFPPIVVVTPAEPREQTADQQVQHVLDRLGFGARPGDVGRVRAMGVDRWIALQLAPERIDDRLADSVLSSYEGRRVPTPELVAAYVQAQLALRERQRQAADRGDSAARRDLRVEVMRDDPEVRERLRQARRALADVQSAKVARAVTSERQLQEVMTDFWSNHFSVFVGKGQTRLFIPSYDRDVIRPNALGHFRVLLGAVAKSPAMLFYLDQWQSAADSTQPTLSPRRRPRLRGRGLNENYARELLELHTLGVDGGYTQQDVVEVARAFTGWTMNPRQQAEFAFRSEIHDAGPKVVLGHALAAGRGIEDGEAVLDLLARDPRTARFIARKLAVRFVSDEPPSGLVERAAAVFLRTDGDIREVVRTIVTSSEFFGRAAYHSKVKSPFELVASALRAIGAGADTSLRSAQAVALLGQPIYGHQAPNGWPETGESWMNTGAILNRINFGLALAANRLPNASIATWSDAERLRTAPREAQVDAVIAAFLGGHASPDTRQILLDGQHPLTTQLAGTSGLPQVVGLAIGAPEFQRR